MNARCLLCLLALCFVAADGRKEDSTKKDVKRIQGTWAFVRIEEEGSTKSQRQLSGMEDRLHWTFKGNQLIRNLGDELAKGKFKLDATKQPPEIDLFDYAGKGKTVRGIYAFDGDQLKICLGSWKTGDRPGAFASPSRSGWTFFLLKRHVVVIKDS